MATGSVKATNDYNDAYSNQVVDISNYTSSPGAFVCPYDGYIVISSATETSGTIRVVIYGPAGVVLPYMYMNITGTYQVQNTYVKRGMKCYVLLNTTQKATITYYPLTRNV